MSDVRYLVELTTGTTLSSPTLDRVHEGPDGPGWLVAPHGTPVFIHEVEVAVIYRAEPLAYGHTPEMTPVAGVTCGYSVACGEPATTAINAGALGVIDTCGPCAALYARLGAR